MSSDSNSENDEGMLEPEAEDEALRLPDDAFPVVGIGASAGGLDAFMQLLKALPKDTGMAFVLIQHLNPKHESKLVELLAKVTELPVQSATDGAAVAPDQVYVIPPDTNMAIVEGRLRLTPRGEARGQHLPLDYFFRSLADDRHSMAIGVVLSGTGSDGTLGLAEIKAAGGLTFAQDQESARYDGMPKSAVHSGSVDFVLTPEEIAGKLALIGRHPYLASREVSGVERSLADHEEPFGQIVRLLRSAFGVDFSLYRKTTLRRRIMRRMVLHPHDTLTDYARHLKDNRAELEALFEDILINVTRFFRDPEMFEELAESVFPEILKRKSSGAPIRIWTAGCSTGQEAYSLAIALSEFLDEKPDAPEIQIFATDLSDAVSLVKARAGHYPESIEAEVSPERLRRFFRKEDGGYRVVKYIRDLCVFAKQNITADPPFSRLDLISCRNVLIYLSAPLQKRIVPTFHYALNPHGYLLLGSAETVGGFSDLFDTVDKQHKIYSRKATSHRVYPHFSADRYVSRLPDDPDSVAPPPGPTEWQKEADRVVVGQYAPVGVLVNDRLEVMQFRGRTSPYLEPASGEASFNLLKMAREGLFGELTQGIAEAREKKATVQRPGVRVRSDGHVRRVDLKIIPLQLPNATEACFLVLFEEPRPPDGGALAPGQLSDGATRTRAAPLWRKLGKLFPGAAGRAGDSSTSTAPNASAVSPEHEELEQLRRELTATRDHQQSIMEQQEAANEELRSANEEVLSSNEELQSTNEELETSKEELQSLNEELTTVNEQLQNRNLEMNRLNNDLSNFFISTQIPVLMLAGNLRLRRFTPAAEKAFNLHAADIGRPLGDIRLSLDVPDLEALVLGTLDTMQHQEKEVQDRMGRWHSLHIRPYRTVENKIEGAVVALLDIDEIKRSETRLQEAADYAESIISTVREPILVLDGELRVQSANATFYRMFAVAPEETDGRLLYELGDGQWDIPQLRRRLEQILPDDELIEDLAVEHDFPAIGPKTMRLNARKLQQKGGKSQLILLAIEDVTERARLKQEQSALLEREQAINEKLRESERRYHHLVENLPAAVYTCDAEGRVTFYNDTAAAIWGREPELGKELWCGSWRLYHADDARLPHNECPMAVAIKEGRAASGEVVIERPDGSRTSGYANATALFDASGEVTGAINLVVDNTERKLAEQAKADLAAIVESSDDAIVSKNLEGVIRSWNRGAERMFGYSAAEAIGQPVTLIVPRDLLSEEEEILEKLRHGEGIDHYETVRVTKDGRRLDVSLTISPVYNAANQVVGASKIARDISDMKRAARALIEADHRKDEFLAMLAHELRNPLAAVSSAVELLGTSGGEVHLEAGRQIIGRQTRLLIRLVDDLLDMSRVTRGIVALRKEVVDAATIVDRAVETVRPLMEGRRHDLKVSVGRKPLRLEGDATRLEQLIANLLANSAKFTAPGGRIEVKARRQSDTIAITVRDNGIGIPAELLPDVFDLFAQSERSADRAAGGLGIGLTLVKSIAELHGGSVEASSDGLRQGSEFTVRLPALADDDTREPAKPRPALAVDSAPARRVLVVDDHKDAALALSRLLEVSGHTVQLAYDGPAALDAAGTFKPHAILLDIGLPELNGYEVAKRMRQDPDLEDILLIAISGYCQDEDRQRSHEAGFDHHLAKPTDHKTLLTLIAEGRPAPILSQD
ncbi:MAG: chemotaxis protein CheB [Woeseia sp.]